ncbi:ribonuclease P protein subunit drpp30 [Phalaenopsis equestris]|uniref:ribonuclease P protein subunit drpp30 n=1 Tax=Phalaenopsis equestris TaxID=78828 RepID=UPI0009E4DA69|nr:ribonuclease P protein subunit drpp30 [Phalaenopsis equestris]
MSFFDLSIPYIEKTSAPAPDARSGPDCRLRTVARAMELGYTAVAYDRPFRGVLSDADRCRIAPFKPQSFLESVAGCSPAAFTSSVALHRDLLGVPRTSPFRQYTRITISVDSAAAASALNIGNRLLRTYDLVATRPLNQMAFDQACSASEVDIISLDFSQKLPFRLKLGMVQAAIKRGVHFEISYSHIIAGGHARRQILSEAKRLGEWTRGKNLIISGSATRFDEVRGPRDVANLSTTLLGLTMERAKAAISKNCRSLVANSLRKKDCYFKEAIKIERILPNEKKDSLSDWFNEWNDWDPISSGENDLPSLDDITKLFSAASKHSKGQNAARFTSSINGMAPHQSDEIDQHDHASPENMVAVVAKSVPKTSNEETKQCSDENGMEINVFENTSLTEMWISDDLSLKAPSPTEFYSVGDEDIEVRDQVDVASCSRDQISMIDNNIIISVEDHYVEQVEIKEKNSSPGDVPLNGYPDEICGQEHISVPLETQVNIEQENQQNSSSEAASTDVVLLDSSAKLEMQPQENVICKRNDPKGFVTKIKCEKKHVSTAEIEGPDVLLVDLSTSVKDDPIFSPENDSPLNKMEQQNMQRPVKANEFTNRHIHKSGKRRLRRRAHDWGYRLTSRGLFKPLFFNNKKAGSLRRMRQFLKMLY